MIASFKVFRIWGMVEAYKDRFYKMSDARGFLLWQGFTRMRCSAGEESNRSRTEKASEFLKRLRHHFSILLCCGISDTAMWLHKDYNRYLEDREPWPGLSDAEAV